MQIVIRGTHLVDAAKLWKRGDLYQVAIVREEMVELLRSYDNKEAIIVVEGVSFRGRLRYETPKRGSPYIRIFLPKRLNVIWSKLHETTDRVKVEIVIEDEGAVR